MNEKQAQPPLGTPGAGGPPNQEKPRPWRTEGLPEGQPPKPRRAWQGWVPWLLVYGLLFGVLTLQDRFAGPQAVPYTEFKVQVAGKNVTVWPSVSVG